MQNFRRHQSNSSDSIVSSLSKKNKLTHYFHYGINNPSEDWKYQKYIAKQITNILINKFHLIIKIADEDKIKFFADHEFKRVKLLNQRLLIIKMNRIKRMKHILKLYFNNDYNLYHGWKSALKDFIRK